MRIGVVADTHMPGRGRELPAELVRGLAGVDLIVHAGDWTTPAVADMLERIAPVEGVAGNNDGGDIVLRFGLRKLLTLAGRRIGVVHGDGTATSTELRAWAAFRGMQPDVVIFGHSHVPLLQHYQGTLLFNPGSPTDKRRQPHYSYGLLTLSDNGIEARHFFYTDKSP